MTELRFGAAVVGGGVVGMAVARALQRGGLATVLLERNERLGLETTSRNSEVVHAGLFYPPESLKTLLCIRGNALLHEWCARRNVPFRPVGKWVVIGEGEGDRGAAALERLHRHARALEIPGVAFASAQEITARFPWLRIGGALEVPSSAIVSAHDLVRSFEADFLAAGGTVALRHRLAAVEPSASGYTLTVELPQGTHVEIGADAVVNAAGLEADRVAALAGIDVDAVGYRQHFWKGNLFEVPRLRGRLPHLIYPIPPAAGTHLGAHLVCDPAGGVRLGPDAQPAPRLPNGEFDYSVHAERAAALLAESRHYVPELTAGDLVPAYAGIRPKLAADGSFRDFVVRQETDRGLAGWINLIGIESPGLTAAPAIGEVVAKLLGVTSQAIDELRLTIDD